MNKIMLLYNPLAGDGRITDKLDDIIRLHQTKGFEVIAHELDRNYDVKKALLEIGDDYSYLLVAGGDGTINSILNHMIKLNLDIPIGILPSGTANDFANHIGIPANLFDASRQIMSSKPVRVDIGKVNEDYFINVACLGLFTDVSQKTDRNMKNSMGKLAYFLKGIQQIPNFSKLPLKLSSKEFNFIGDAYILLVFNGNMAGNMNIAYKARVNDGLLDVVLVNPESLLDVFPLLVKLIRGNHLENPVGLSYFQTDSLLIESDDRDITTDIDGEFGPDLPLRISCIRNGISIMGVIDETKI